MPVLALDPFDAGDQRLVLPLADQRCSAQVSVAAVGDVDGDGLEDLAARTYDGPERGRG